MIGEKHNPWSFSIKYFITTGVFICSPFEPIILLDFIQISDTFIHVNWTHKHKSTMMLIYGPMGHSASTWTLIIKSAHISYFQVGLDKSRATSYLSVFFLSFQTVTSIAIWVLGWVKSTFLGVIWFPWVTWLASQLDVSQGKFVTCATLGVEQLDL